MTLIEQVGGDFGVTVIYTLGKHRKVSIQFFAAEIVARGENDEALYTRRGADVCGDHVTDPALAERFIEGYVKWDGCSHINFGDENGYLHLCGREHIDKLTETLTTIYERCGALMREHGGSLLEGKFELNTPKDPS